jgi:type III restriction enzyme
MPRTFHVRYKDKLVQARSSVLTVEGHSLVVDIASKSKTLNDFVADADVPVIEDAYRRAARTLGSDITRTYAEHLADQHEDPDSVDDALLDAHATVAALGLIPEIKNYLDAEATKLSNEWFDAYRVDIRGLSDERQETYRQIKEMSSDPQEIDLARPTSWMVHSKARSADGTETDLPTYKNHLLCNSEGLFPMDVGSSWENDVLSREMGRAAFRAWYRNPGRASQDSLGIPYKMDSVVKMVRPDFVIFTERADGSIAASIVDPHGTQFADALPKLKGLADYAETHSQHYQRIDAVAKVGDALKVLDLTNPGACQAVREATSIKDLYSGQHANNY